MGNQTEETREPKSSGPVNVEALLEYIISCRPAKPATMTRNRLRQSGGVYKPDRGNLSLALSELSYNHGYAFTGDRNTNYRLRQSTITTLVKKASDIGAVDNVFIIPRLTREGEEPLFVLIEDLEKFDENNPKRLVPQFPCGGNSEGETSIACAYRELIEEIDRDKLLPTFIEERNLRVIGSIEEDSGKSPGGRHFIGVFTVDLPMEIKDFLVFGEEQRAIHFFDAEIIDILIDARLMLSNHTRAWHMYQDSLKLDSM